MTDERFRELWNRTAKMALVDSRDLREALQEVDRLTIERNAAVTAVRALQKIIADINISFARIFKK